MKSQIYRKSANTEGHVFTRIWQPVGSEIKGTIIIVHGMAEHSGRYEQFAEYLVEKGYAVYANDHLGHGHTAKEGRLGHLPEGGWKMMVEDIRTLVEFIKNDQPGKKIAIFGHSMGSFITRSFLAKYGKEIDCAVICGTASDKALSSFGIIIASIQKKMIGEQSVGNMLDKLAFGPYGKKFKNNPDSKSWLSRDKDRNKNYFKDELCGFKFSASGFYELLSAMKQINTDEWANSVPNEVPLFLVSGKDDPVGDFGKGVEKVYEILKKTGHNVSIKLYDGARHELTNETNRQEVFEDAYRFINTCIGDIKTTEED